jgi:hypothetical protein
MAHASRTALIALLAGTGIASAQPATPLPCEAKDTACMMRALHSHAARKLATWHPALARPLVERVEPAPPAIVEYLRWDNAMNGYSEVPTAAQVPATFIAEVKAALADLPLEVNLLFADKLAGVFLVEDLGGTGYTELIANEAGHAVAGFIVLDAGVLQGRRANEWATWKERSPFKPDADWELDARIETDTQDSRRNAIQYILLHELGHVLSIGNDLHPPWDRAPTEAGAPDDFRFSRLAWRLDGNRHVSTFEADFPLRADVVYYFGAKLPASAMQDVYAQLRKTNFPSLYAATRPGDDFAESFASYVHTVLMQRPWEIVVRRGGHDVAVFKACWDEPRCAGKRKVLESLLKP